MGNEFKGQFGSAVIGEEAAREEQEYIESGKAVFGPSVLDSDHAPAKQNISEASGRKLTRPGRKGNTTAPTAKAEPKPDLEEFMIGIRGLKRALLGDGDKEGNPLLVDEFMQAELIRPDGIRKTAVTTLIDAEKRRPSGPRVEVMAVLDEWMEEAG